MDLEVKLLSRQDVAKILGIGKSNVSDLIGEGRIGFVVIGKRIFIPFKEIQNFIDTNTIRVTAKAHHNASEEEDLSSTQFLETLINKN